MSLTTHPDAIQAVLALVRPGLVRVEASLAALANTDDAVLGPMLSTVLPGSGKRLRPALALLIARMGQVPSADALNHMAVGVELLHTASLVHDDIVDESDTRHGGATLYTRVGNALAVLVGDYLFSQAAQECVATGDLTVVRLFAETLGAMAQGQIDDAKRQLGGRDAWETLSRERYYRTISGKTASLFVLACQGTAQLAALTPPQVDALRTYGEHLGLAFQVGEQRLERALRVPDDIQLVGVSHPDQRAVAVDLDGPCLVQRRVELRVREARPDGQQRVAAHHQLVAGRRPEQADGAGDPRQGVG